MKRPLFICLLMMSITGFAQDYYTFTWGYKDDKGTPALKFTIRSKPELENAKKKCSEWTYKNNSPVIAKQKIEQGFKDIVAGYNKWEEIHGDDFQTSSTATQANEILERNKETVAANNEYTRNIGPRNGWNDTKTGTTIIRETNVKTNVTRPRAFKPVEEPSETPKDEGRGEEKANNAKEEREAETALIEADNALVEEAKERVSSKIKAIGKTTGGDYVHDYSKLWQEEIERLKSLNVGDAEIAIFTSWFNANYMSKPVTVDRINGSSKNQNDPRMEIIQQEVERQILQAQKSTQRENAILSIRTLLKDKKRFLKDNERKQLLGLNEKIENQQRIINNTQEIKEKQQKQQQQQNLKSELKQLEEQLEDLTPYYEEIARLEKEIAEREAQAQQQGNQSHQNNKNNKLIKTHEK